jgi:hypothetical protein
MLKKQNLEREVALPLTQKAEQFLRIHSESIEQTLEDRDKKYGDFKGHALITQKLKQVMFETLGWERLADDQKECLEMVAHKIGRILNGDPNYKDSWHDIVGYVKLVDDKL